MNTDLPNIIYLFYLTYLFNKYITYLPTYLMGKNENFEF